MTRPWPWLALAIPLALTLVLYWPLPGSWFWADDFVCMASIVNDGFLRFVLRPFGGHNLLVRNLVFYASWHLFGLHAAPYFWTMLLTHLVNVWLLFRVLRRLTSSVLLACFGATLWGTSPLAAGVLAWYAVYGQALVATMFLVVLDGLVARAQAGMPVSVRTAWTWYGLLLLGTVCFGVGLGVALAFPVALFVMLPAAWRQPWLRAAYVALPLVTIALYVGLRRLYPLLIEPLSADELNVQPVGLDMLPRALAAVAALVAFSFSEYTRNFFSAARAYPDRATPVVLAVLVGGMVVVLWRGSATTRRAAIAMIALSVGVYLAIALGRTTPASVGISLTTLATQQRYHYVAVIPLVILICLILQEIGRIGWLERVPRVPLLLAWLGLWVWGFARSPYRVELHLGPRRVVDMAVLGIDAEVTLHPPGGTVYLDNGANSRTMLGPVMRDPDFPGRAAIFLLTHEGDQVDGRRVRFVVRNPEVLARYQRRPDAPLARLLVSPEAAAEGR